MLSQVLAVVIFDAVVSDDVRAEHFDQFGAIVGPVQPRRNQNKDVAPRNAGLLQRAQ